MSQLELAPGFSMANARVCLGAASRAYTDEPTISTPLMRCRIEGPRDKLETPHVVSYNGQRAVIIAFRGTASVRDFVTDAEFWRNPLASFEVHHGFREAFAAIIPLLQSWPGWDDLHLPIIVTGHSLGGAMAQLAAWALHVAGFPVHSVYTFGGPRVGDAAWASEYDRRLGERTWRCVNQVDVVPRLPGVLIGYRHVGHEAFIPAFGSLTVDPAFWFKVASDAICLYAAWKGGRLALLPNHALTAYEAKMGQPRMDTKAHEWEEPFCALPKL